MATEFKLTKSDERGMATARMHLAGGNRGAYDRLTSALVRAATSARAEAALRAAIDADFVPATGLAA